jgi:O-acetylhomoserine/O-acetylserine sulfhydrylase
VSFDVPIYHLLTIS